MLWHLYKALTRYEAVYLFYLVPILYFMSIVARLVYYKLKYHKKVYARDIIALAFMILIFLDYINYIYLLVSGTGQVLPFSAFLVKYAIGFLLWAWMFWYSYQVHLKQSLTVNALKKHRIMIAFVCSMIIILVVIGIIVS